MNTAFTLRLARCFLIGIGAFVMLVAADVKIRSVLDVAGYVLGAGGLWYVFELIVMTPQKKKTPPPDVVKQYQVQNPTAAARRKQARNKPTESALGEDHF